LNSVDAIVNLLSIILSNQSDEEIQAEMFDLIGYENFEMG